MYLGIDIGGTKTLVASLDDHGVIQESKKFPTPQQYAEFLVNLEKVVADLSTKTFTACGVGAPGKIDRPNGIGLDMGHLPWHNVGLGKDISAIAKCPVVVDNDANLAGLSEAMLVKKYDRVLYVTISTGIGSGFIVNQAIEPSMADSEGGHIILEHKGKLQTWESFASGQAIANRFGKKAQDITDDATWKIIAHDIALGLIDLIAVLQPQIIILGGSVGTYFERFGEFLRQSLAAYANPLVSIPPIKQAERPEDAVVYGCYDLATSTYGKAH